MRWVFFSLLFVNAVAFVWQLLATGGGDPTGGVKLNRSREIQGVPGITLLSELDKDDLAQMMRGKSSKKKSEERGRGNERQSQGRPRLAEVDDSADGGRPLCTLVGPFKQLLKAEYFVERISALDILADVQEVEIPGDVGYWVYLPPEVSSKEALRRLHELQRKGIDSYVIPKGELANGISFGMFSQRELALGRRAQMQNQGYDVEIKEVARSYKEVWAILQPHEAQKLGEDLWQKVLSGNPGLDRRQNFCPTVASSDNFH